MAVGGYPVAVNPVTGALTYDSADPFSVLTSNRLTTGDESFSREHINTQGVLSASGEPRFAFFTARRSFTSTQVRMYAGSTAAGATPTLARMGLWAISGDTATLVASTANDTSLFSVAFASNTRSWSSSYALVAGARYAVGAIVVTGATAPTIGGGSISYAVEAGLAPCLTGYLTGQTDLPASFSVSGLTVTTQRPYAAVLP